MSKTTFIKIILTALFLTANAFAQTSAFVYQGKLNDGTLAANGSYQFEFKLYDAASVNTGNQIGNTLSNITTTVVNGIFSVNLDFGAESFDGAARYLEISVRLDNSGQNYTTLNPRQLITATPYAVKSLKSDQATTAITANDAANLGSLPAAQYTQNSDARLSDARTPTAFSPFYIQNGTDLQTSANFNVSGEGRANILSAATQFNLGANRILSGAGAGNIFVGVNAGVNNTGSNNAFFRQIAGVSNTTGSFNTALGTGAGDNNTTGANNTFVGYLAGQANTGESDNTFIGYKTLGANGITNATAIGANAFVGASNTMVLGTNSVTVQVPGSLTVAGTFSAGILNASTQYNIGGNRFLSVSGTNNTFAGLNNGTLNTGTNNSFFGKFTGAINSTGSFNAFFGTNAGAANTTGNDNAFFGQAAGFKNTEGINNTATGSGAGLNNTTGSNNTFLGQLSGLSNTLENNNTFLGYKSNGAVGITNATAIGANAVVTTSNTMVLGTNTVTVFAPGSFNSATDYKIGGFRVLGGTIAQHNLFAGFQAGESNTTGITNTFLGRSAGFANTTGSANVFAGYNAGRFNSDGNDNSFFGTEAGAANTSGGSNAFFGRSAGKTNLTGLNNSFYGANSGEVNSTGNFNAFFGKSSGQTNTNGSGNSFFGNNAGFNNADGSNNSFFGRNAGFSNTGGTNNTFIGNAGLANTTGDRNTFIGFNAGAANLTGSNNTAVGAGANFFSDNLTFATAIGAGTVVNQSNTIAIGRSDGSDRTNVIGKLEVNGTVNVFGTLQLPTIQSAAGQSVCIIFQTKTLVQCAFNPIQQENIQTFTRGLELLAKLRPVTFTVKEGGASDIGFVAEELNEVEPLLANRNETGRIEGVKYAQITTVLVNAVNQQQTQINALNEQIKTQQLQIDALKTLVCSQNPTAGICQPPNK